MTSPLSRSLELAREAENIIALRRLEADATGLETQAQAVRAMADDLEPLARAAEVLASVGLDRGYDRQRVGAIRQAAEIVAAKFEQDAATVISPDADARNRFWERVEGLTQSVRLAIEAAWGTHKDSVLPTVEPEVIGVLALVPGASEAVAGLRAAHFESQQLPAVPRSMADVERLHEIATAASAAIARLGADSVPEVVRTFLRSASAGEATLDDVTDEVAGWLRTWGLTGRVRVSLA